MLNPTLPKLSHKNCRKTPISLNLDFYQKKGVRGGGGSLLANQNTGVKSSIIQRMSTKFTELT